MGRWRRYAGAASGAVLGGIALNVPGAVYGGYWGYKKGKESEQNFTKNSQMQRRDSAYGTGGNRKRKLSIAAGSNSRIKRRLFNGPSQRGAYLKAVGKRTPNMRRGGRRRPGRKGVKKGPAFTSGPYTGSFKRPKKVTKTIEQLCQSSGYHRTLEVHGAVNDPNCVFITHSTNHINEIGYTITYALLRKILTKAGFKVTNQFNAISVTGAATGVDPAQDTTGLRFVYTVKNPVLGNTNVTAYDTVGAQSFTDLCIASSFMSAPIIEYLRRQANDVPYKLAVYIKDEAIASYWRLGAEMFLEDCDIQLFTSSVITLQNRTLSANATGDTYDIDRVDNQPIKGMIYNFKHGEPRVRNQGSPPGGALWNNSRFNRMTDFGVTLDRGAEFIGGGEPFTPKYFQNIEKAIPVLMQPGEMKKTTLFHKFSGKLKTVFKNIRVDFYDVGTAYCAGVSGRSQMLCFEETMRTASSNKITVSYERELKVGCIIKHSFYQAPLETFLTSQSYNNIV